MHIQDVPGATSQFRNRASLVALLIAYFLVTTPVRSQQTSSVSSPTDVPTEYRKFFKKASPGRSLPTKLLAEHGIDNQQIGRSYALIVGVSQYKRLGPEKQSLPPAKVDVDALVSFLETNEYFDEIVVLENDDVTLENLNYFLGFYFPNKLGAEGNDRFLFAYSGHGFDSGDDSYLLKSSAEAMDDRLHSIDLAQLKISVEKSASKALNALILINSCQAGSFLNRIPFGDYRLIVPKVGAHAITAGARGQLTYASATTGRGSYFFEEVLRGLKGDADVKNVGIITSNELFSYVRREVARDTDNDQDPQFGDVEPHGSQGAFFFLRSLPSQSQVAVVPPKQIDKDCAGALELDNYTYSLANNFQDDFLRSIDVESWQELQQAGAASVLFASGKSFLGGDYSLKDDYTSFDQKRTAHLKSVYYSRSYDQAVAILRETSATREYPSLTACMQNRNSATPTLLIWPSHETLDEIVLHVRYAGPSGQSISAESELFGGAVDQTPPGRLFKGVTQWSTSSRERIYDIKRTPHSARVSVSVTSVDNSFRVAREFLKADAVLTTRYSGSKELPQVVTRHFSVRTPNNNENRGHCPNEVGHHDGKYCTSRTTLELTTAPPHFFKNARIDCAGGGCPWGATGPVSISPDGLKVSGWVDNWGSPFDATLTAEESIRISATQCGPDTAVAVMKEKPVLIGVPKDCLSLASVKWILLSDLSEGIFRFGDTSSPGGEIAMNGSLLQDADSAVASYSVKK